MATRDEAREVASRGENIRDRVRELTARALRGRTMGRGRISGLVTEVMEGAAEGVDRSMPENRANVLRQVYEGMSEAVQAAASAGVRAARSAGQRGRKLVEQEAPAAGRRIRAANEEFLGAVTRFAGRVSGEARDELNELVRRARLAGPTVAGPARDAVRAADGHLLELTGEAARAGLSLVRRAAGGLAMAAGGLLEGIGEAVSPPAGSPPKPKAAARKARPAKRAPARRKPAARRVKRPAARRK